MTDHSKTSQDLRTALELARDTLEGIARDVAACEWLTDYDASPLPQIYAALSTPPRPDHAGGVEAAAEAMWQDESLRCRGTVRLIDFSDEAPDIQMKWLRLARVALDAQAPPQAAEREGVVDTWPTHYSPEFLAARDAELAKQRAEVTALAPSPSGTEASRVSCDAVEAASAAFYDSMIGSEAQFWPHHQGWAGKDKAFKGRVRERMRLALDAALAAPPTPPVSPPDSTGQGEARRHEWCQPGDQPKRHWVVKFEDTERGEAVFTDETEAREYFARADGGGWNCWLFAAAQRAALSSQEKTDV